MAWLFFGNTRNVTRQTPSSARRWTETLSISPLCELISGFTGCVAPSDSRSPPAKSIRIRRDESPPPRGCSAVVRVAIACPPGDNCGAVEYADNRYEKVNGLCGCRCIDGIQYEVI